MIPINCLNIQAIFTQKYWKTTTEYLTEEVEKVVEDFASRVPLCPDVSLKEKSKEENVDYNEFLGHLVNQKGDQEMANELGIAVSTVEHLREHFEKVGVHSILGQD